MYRYAGDADLVELLAAELFAAARDVQRQGRDLRFKVGVLRVVETSLERKAIERVVESYGHRAPIF